ncbi:MAG: hypothetical protein U0Y10_00645 [Spirosomataceae bacterium]
MKRLTERHTKLLERIEDLQCLSGSSQIRHKQTRAPKDVRAQADSKV